MGATIYLSVKLGQWLDAFFYNDQKLFVILGCLLGIAISFYFLLRQLKRFQQ